MLTITDEQMKVLGAYSLSGFENRVVTHLRARFPGACKDITDEQLLTFARKGIDKAEGYGIEYEDDIRRFMEYLVMYGTNLDAREDAPWLGDVLRRPDLDGTTKMDRIDSLDLQVLRQQTWAG